MEEKLKLLRSQMSLQPMVVYTIINNKFMFQTIYIKLIFAYVCKT